MASIGIPRLVIAKILNHTERRVTAIYDRYSYDREKREALETWAARLDAIVSAGSDCQQSGRALPEQRSTRTSEKLFKRRWTYPQKLSLNESEIGIELLSFVMVVESPRVAVAFTKNLDVELRTRTQQPHVVPILCGESLELTQDEIMELENSQLEIDDTSHAHGPGTVLPTPLLRKQPGRYDIEVILCLLVNLGSSARKTGKLTEKARLPSYEIDIFRRRARVVSDQDRGRTAITI